MKKKLNLFILFVFIFINLSALKVQAMEEKGEKIFICFSNGNKKLVIANTGLFLSKFREILIQRQQIGYNDIFQIQSADIVLEDEKSLTIQDILQDGCVYLKDEEIKTKWPKITDEPEIKANASKYRPEIRFELNPPNSNISEYQLPRDTIISITNDKQNYHALSKEERKCVFQNLDLQKLILAYTDDNGDLKVEVCFKEGIIWTKEPGFRNPQYNRVDKTDYTVHKSMHELKKMGVTTVSSGVSCFGCSVDARYSTRNESLRRQEETEIYLYDTRKVFKLELCIDKRDIKLSNEFEDDIRKAIEGKNPKLEDLINVFKEYGFCVPTKFILGGELYCEETQKVSSETEAQKAQTEFAAEVRASFFVSVHAGFSQSNSTESTRSESHMTHHINKIMTAGDPATINNAGEWAASLGPINEWRIIERAKFYPVIEFISQPLQNDCKALIRRYWDGKWEDISLPALQGAVLVYVPRLCNIASKAYDFLCRGFLGYKIFLSGRLIYKPNIESDIDQVELRIVDLVNPLSGEFDLSLCGDAGQYLSIFTGNPRRVGLADPNKIEIWLVPKLVKEREGRDLQYRFLEIWNLSPLGIVWRCKDIEGHNHWREVCHYGKSIYDGSLSLFEKWSDSMQSHYNYYVDTPVDVEQSLDYLKHFELVFSRQDVEKN